MKALGASAEDIKAVQAQIEKPQFVVFKENFEVVSFFRRLATQWNVSAFGSMVGLNYQSIDFLFRIEGIRGEKARSMMGDLRILEAAVLNFVNSQKKKEG